MPTPIHILLNLVAVACVVVMVTILVKTTWKLVNHELPEPDPRPITFRGLATSHFVRASALLAVVSVVRAHI